MIKEMIVKQSELETLSKEELARAAAALFPAAFGQKPRLDHLQDPENWGSTTFVQVKAASQEVLTPAVYGQAIGQVVGSAVRDAEDRLAGKIQQIAQEVTALGVSANLALKGVSDLTDAARPPLDEVEGLVRNAVAAAFKPLQESLNAAPAEIQRQVVEASPRELKSVEEVFDLPGEKGEVEVWGPRGEIDPDYIFNPQLLRMALKALELRDNFWLFGERGTGKTQFAMQLAARLGRKIFRVSFDRTMERLDFLGGGGVENGDTVGVWQDGVVLLAMRTPGAICLLDEVARGKPEYLVALNALLEPGGTYTIPITGEVVNRAPGMIFIAADNTDGNGDETGRYTNANQMDSSFLDRFAFSEEVLFLPVQQEVDLLIRKGADPALAKKLVDMINVCRAKVGAVDGPVEPPSLRQVMAFVRYYGSDTDEMVFKRTIINKSSSMSAEALLQIFTSQWEV